MLKHSPRRKEKLEKGKSSNFHIRYFKAINCIIQVVKTQKVAVFLLIVFFTKILNSSLETYGSHPFWRRPGQSRPGWFIVRKNLLCWYWERMGEIYFLCVIVLLTCRQQRCYSSLLWPLYPLSLSIFCVYVCMCLLVRVHMCKGLGCSFILSLHTNDAGACNLRGQKIKQEAANRPLNQTAFLC